jgi:pyruvate carboxylase subunit B
MFKLKKIQGTDIARSFDGLNDTRNLKLSIEYAKEGGMISQTALCITHSKLHTVDYYLRMAEELIDMGSDEICIKDMAGIGRPASMGKLVEGIKAIKKDILVTYHGHSGPGFSVASSLEAARAGVDFIDVGMEPLSFGTGHADLLTIHEVLKDAGFSVPDINMKAYMSARSLTQEFIDDFLGYYINPKNRLMNSLLIGPGLPGGMMGSLMADLEKNLSSLNKWMEKKNRPKITQDELMIALFDEVKTIWPMMGYPPLVTPYSQYVKNAALVNVMQIMKGKERWSLLDDNTWDMLLGKSGRVPGEISAELKQLAQEQSREFFTGNPQDLYSDSLESFKSKMQEKGWDTGQDDEELFEYAMHPEQYEDYRSGIAKERFKKDLEAKSKPANETTDAPENAITSQPKNMQVLVNGESFNVEITYKEDHTSQPKTSGNKVETTPKEISTNGQVKEIVAPLEGKVYFTKDSSEKPLKIGDSVAVGDIVCYIEAMKVRNAVKSDVQGKLIEVLVNDGEEVLDDDIIMKIG